MDMHVLFDRSGNILAAVQLSGETSEVPLPRPEPERGQRTAEVSVPEEFRKLSFLEACTQLVVRAQRGKAMLLRKRQRAVPAAGTVRKPAERKARTPTGRSRSGQTKRA